MRKCTVLVTILWMSSCSCAKPVREMHIIPRLSAPTKAFRRVGDVRPTVVFNERQSAPLIQATPPVSGWRIGLSAAARLHRPQLTRERIAASAPAGQPVLTRETPRTPLKIVSPPSVSQVGLPPGADL